MLDAQKTPYTSYDRAGHRTSRFVVDLTRPAEVAVPETTIGQKTKKYGGVFFAALARAIYLPFKFIGKGCVLVLSFSYSAIKWLISSTVALLKSINASVLSFRARSKPADPAYRTDKRPAGNPLYLPAETSERFLPMVEMTGEPAPDFNFRPLKFKPILIFATVLFALVLPFKAYTYYISMNGLKIRVTASSEHAIEEFMLAGKSATVLDFAAAGENFSEAGADFAAAQDNLQSINDWLLKLAALAPSDKLRLAADSKNILAAGESAAKLGADLSSAVDALTDKTGDRPLSERLNGFINFGGQAAADCLNLNSAISKIDINNLPEAYRDKFSMIKQQGSFLENGLSELVRLAEKFKTFLGASDLRRYLLVFQNNSEARASGGFLGSFARLDVSQGRILKLDAPGGGTYDTEAGLRDRIIAPRPLWLVNPLWHMWDANWWPDWPKSAEKIAWFYEHSNEPTVDGVISLTPTVLEEFLRVLGPVDMQADYGVTIDADNFWPTVQAFAEQKPAETNKPKKIIGDLFNKILEVLPDRLDQKTLFALIKSAEKSLAEKQILMYFRDETLQRVAAEYGADGRVGTTAWDYLSVVNSNIAGGKTDRVISQGIEHQSVIAADGTITDTLKITRTHNGIKREEFTGMRNVDWLRVYVPRGSVLLSATGFIPPETALLEQPEASWTADPDLLAETHAGIFDTGGTKIYEESDKTVFANWLMLDPGEVGTVYLKYRLPFKLEKKPADDWPAKMNRVLNPDQKTIYPFALMLQKQPGSFPSTFESTLSVDPAFNAFWRWPENTGEKNNGWHISDTLDTDKYWAIMFES